MDAKEHFFNQPGKYLMKKDYRMPVGKYRGFSIEEIMAWGMEGLSYLAYVYYSIEWIDFTDDIVVAVGLEKIDKPGTKENGVREWEESRSEEEKGKLNTLRMAKAAHYGRVERDRIRVKNVKTKRRDNLATCKSRLAWKNQGH